MNTARTQYEGARTLFLELMALELDLNAFEDATAEGGYSLEVRGLKSLSPTHADRIRQRISDHRLGLMRILLTHRFFSDARALVEEGR